MSGSKDSHSDNLTQAERFVQAARKHEADESEAAWEARLKKIVKPKKQKK
jgi:hypothetical protein